jgi:3'5'-cyclic nucleotide phosphodiesterase
MATDVMDKDLNTLRNDKWEKAFKYQSPTDSSKLDEDNVINRKATIVIEYIIQASDIAHTMQHWEVYRRWNERLFTEMYLAYHQGRSETDPSEFWFEGEIGFFDHYIIPLTKKLRDCGVFGVSSDEYMNYAMKNREEWEAKGQEVVAFMVEKLSHTLRANHVDL